MSKKISSIIKAVPFVIAIGISAGGFLFTQINKKKEQNEKTKQDNSSNITSTSEPCESKIEK